MRSSNRYEDLSYIYSMRTQRYEVLIPLGPHTTIQDLYI
jgi:hypothetical protein